ncbi:MAG TPA: 50S ribosomal protein L18 [Candidatus Paceibacterota bacterium]
MKRDKAKLKRREQRKKRTRSRIRGTASKPRLTVFRSNKHLFVQLIDDEKGRTLASASTRALSSKSKSKIASSSELGKVIAEAAKKAGINSAVFDRGAYQYHGRIKALAESARSSGLKI